MSEERTWIDEVLAHDWRLRWYMRWLRFAYAARFRLAALWNLALDRPVWVYPDCPEGAGCPPDPYLVFARSRGTVGPHHRAYGPCGEARGGRHEVREVDKWGGRQAPWCARCARVLGPEAAA